MKHKPLALLAFLSAVFCSADSARAQAQFVGIPNGVGVTPLVPTFGNATSSYGLNSGITCPTPTFNLTGFGGDTDGTSRGRGGETISLRATADVTNWGLAAGVSIPFASKELRDFCNRYAQAQADFQSSVATNQKLNSELTLLRQCIFINDDLGINIQANKEAFSGDGPLASFSGCLSLGNLLEVTKRNPAIQLVPPQLPTKSSTKEATPVIITP